MCTYVNTRVVVRDSELGLLTMPSLALHSSVAPYCPGMFLSPPGHWHRGDPMAPCCPSLALQPPTSLLSERQGQDTVDHQVWDSVIGKCSERENSETGQRFVGTQGLKEGKG